MIHSLHISQEAGGADWWGKMGFPIGSENDPRLWAERLAEVTGNPEEADDLLRDMRALASRDFIYSILKAEQNL
ncbi:hypothetical protein J7382_08490 [Shimia sp. R11_0]|uniref:hypothetical protein n=1 Tax=Shimia sp. R11_0 TaxID=2821096 RepID=UPI001ADCF99D|nr:hypothetical protein [Shimia sp. R11_0]MBO9477567.1 hypothetical protein [Shimia sp. R11_0]